MQEQIEQEDEEPPADDAAPDDFSNSVQFVYQYLRRLPNMCISVSVQFVHCTTTFVILYKLIRHQGEGEAAPDGDREFTKGGFIVKRGLAIDAFPLCNCNTLGSVFNV